MLFGANVCLARHYSGRASGVTLAAVIIRATMPRNPGSIPGQYTMRLRRIALWLASGLTLLLIAGFCWLWFGNLGVFKPQLERLVSEKTGREFVIDGRFDVDLGHETVIIAEEVRFENADWSEYRQMLEVGYLEVRVDTFSLFGAPLTIELVEVDDVEIRLEQPESGVPNWRILPTAGRADPGTVDDGSILDVIVGTIDADEVHIVYESPERTGPLDLRITSLRQEHRQDDFLELALDGELNERNFDIRAVAGTWNALLAEKNVEYEIEGQLDTFSLFSKGTIDDLVAPNRPLLTFAASGPDINDLLRLLKIEEGGKGDIDLTGSLTPEEDGPLTLDVEGRLGQMTIDASGSVSDLQSLEQFDATLRASSPDLSRILALFGFEGVRKAPFTLDLDASRQGRVLEIERAHLEFADAEFDVRARLPGFPSLDDGNARIDIKGSDFARLRELLQLPGAAEGPFSLGLELESDEQGEEILRISLASTLAKIEANGRVAPDVNYVGSELDFTLASESLARTGKAYNLPTLPDLPMTVRGSFAVESDAIRLRGPVTADIDGTRLQVEGVLALAPRLAGSRLSVGLEAPDLATLVGMFVSSENVPPLPINVTGDIQLQGDRLRFGNVDGSLGQSSVAGEGTLRLAKGIAGSEFSVVASGPAFEELTAHIRQFDPQPGTFDLSGGLAFGTDRIRFSDVRLTRPRGALTADVTIGLAQPAALVDFDIDARGPSLQSIVTSLGDFEPADAPFRVAARGTLRDRRLVLDKFDVEAGQAKVEADGELDLSLDGQSTDFSFDLNVPSLARLGLLKQRRLRQQALAIRARVRGDGNALRADNLDIRLGDSDIRGSLQLQKGDVPSVSLELQSELIRLAPLLEESDAEYEKAPKFDDGRVIPDVEVPFDALRKLNASIALDVGELYQDSSLLRDIALRAQLQDGGLYLEQVGFRAGNGWLAARGALEPADGAGRATLALKADDLAFSFIGLKVGPETRTDIDINLEATGTDLRTLAGNLSGVLFLDGRNFTGERNAALQRFYGDMLNEILETINPFSKSDPEARISCIILPVEINDGMLGVNPEALLQTNNLRIVSDASINLKSEKLEMTFRTTPRKGLTISAGEILNPFVMVVGTLAEPRLAVDAKGSLISGGAAVATGGLSILARATWERLVRSKNPCDTASAQGKEKLQDRFADFTAPARQ